MTPSMLPSCTCVTEDSKPIFPALYVCVNRISAESSVSILRHELHCCRRILRPAKFRLWWSTQQKCSLCRFKLATFVTFVGNLGGGGWIEDERGWGQERKRDLSAQRDKRREQNYTPATAALPRRTLRNPFEPLDQHLSNR